MDNKSQYFFIAVMLFLKQPFIFGDDCKCEGLVNVFKSTMSREIFDLKMENTMLQARMDKMESMLQEKSSSTSSRDLDTARLEGFENRLSSIESKKQHTIKVPTNTLKLHSLIAKALGSEKVKRIRAESHTRKQMQFFNQSISDLKIKVDFMLNSNLTYIVDDIEKVEHGLHQVKNDIRNIQSNISELQIQTNALSGNVISELGTDLAAINQSVAMDIAEIDQRMSKANQCPELPSIRNGEISQNTNEGVRNVYGSVAEYTCNIGYYLNGNTELKVYERVCQADGTWDGEPPICDVPRCEQILDFYGGDVTYIGDRKVYSQAVYRCDDAFSLIPRHVSVSECDDTLRWIPDPPNCYKKAKKEIPANGYSPQGSSGILLHKESYRVHCYANYELKSGAKYLDRTRELIVNINGTLEPKLECVGERCDPSKQYRANVKYENGTEVHEKFPSQTDVFLSCKRGYDYYRGDRPMQTPLKRTCIKGNIKNAPKCQEAWCLFSGYPNNEDTFHRVYRADARLVAEDQYIYPRETMEVFCKKGFELYINSSKSYRRQEFTSECRYGKFSETKEKFPICLEKRCDPEDLSNAVVMDKKGERIRTKIPSRTEVYLLCQNGYEYYSNGRPMNKPVIRECVKGTITNAPECEERCAIYNITNGRFMKDAKYLKAGETVKHGESVTVECEDAYYNADLSMECYNGKWQQEIDCSDPSSRSTTVISTDATTTVNGDSTTESEDYYEYYESLSEDVPPGENQSQNKKEKGCKLSDDERYTYEDSGGNEINPGSNISDGTTLTVKCTTLDLYEYYIDYDYGYDTESRSDPTITCADNTISQFELDCYEVAVDTCMELKHGNVRMENGYYIVSCDKGYSLNLILPEKTQCGCKGGTLRSVYGNQVPRCIPDNCTVPYFFDGRLSVTGSNGIGLTGGSVVLIEDFVFINCSKANEPNYEPLNRKFLCSNGLWIEAERDSNLKLRYNGRFPSCRKAICEPNCTNDGVCFKDDMCRCKHLTEGRRCENVICDNKCLINGGTCVGPGVCDCPRGKFGDNCEKEGCLLPKDAAKYKDSRTMFFPGEIVTALTCDDNSYILSSRDGMTCQDDGSWSNVVKCTEAVVYLISVKTVDAWNSGAGTDANVYISLHGLRGRTEKIYLTGSFEAGDLDETRVKAKDVRPITSVVIGHDGSGVGSDWYFEHVSIYVENMEEYYVFRHNDWVEEQRDVFCLDKDLINKRASIHLIVVISGGQDGLT